MKKLFLVLGLCLVVSVCNSQTNLNAIPTDTITWKAIHSLQNRVDKGRNMFLFAGVTALTAGVLNMIAYNKKAPDAASNINTYEDNVRRYNDDIKTLHNTSAASLMLSGIFISAGALIHFK